MGSASAREWLCGRMGACDAGDGVGVRDSRSALEERLARVAVPVLHATPRVRVLHASTRLRVKAHGVALRSSTPQGSHRPLLGDGLLILGNRESARATYLCSYASAGERAACAWAAYKEARALRSPVSGEGRGAAGSTIASGCPSKAPFSRRKRRESTTLPTCIFNTRSSRVRAHIVQRPPEAVCDGATGVTLGPGVCKAWSRRRLYRQGDSTPPLTTVQSNTRWARGAPQFRSHVFNDPPCGSPKRRYEGSPTISEPAA